MLCYYISGLRTCYLPENYFGLAWVEDLEVVGASLHELPYLIVGGLRPE